MRYPVLHSYLSRLANADSAGSRLRVDAEGRVQGQLSNGSLTSLFQPVRDLTGDIRAFDALADTCSSEDRGLSVWRMLNDASGDNESIELDRLCRMTHVLNYFRQVEDDNTDVLIGVHERLLAAVSSNHGAVFGRILDGLQLPRDRILLQLPESGAETQWLIGHVADNYRRNGFRIATRAASPEEAIRQIMQLRPDLVRIHGQAAEAPALLADLLQQSAAREVTLLFSGIDAEADLHPVAKALDLTGGTGRQQIRIMGAQAGVPATSLAGAVIRSGSNHAPHSIRTGPRA